jgi:hypothetical protein
MQFIEYRIPNRLISIETKLLQRIPPKMSANKHKLNEANIIVLIKLK